MKVLISWSGERSKQVAIALHKFLKRVIQATDPWISEKDIGAGSFWHEELWSQLSKAKAGIICLTREMLDSKWVHFEAGVLAKAVGQICVCPYLFDLKPSEIQGPLTFLQCTLANKEQTERMVQAINEKLGDKQLSAADLKDAFEAHWSWLEDQLKKVSGAFQQTPAKNVRPIEDVLEEILEGIRELKNQAGSQASVLDDYLWLADQSIMDLAARIEPVKKNTLEKPFAIEDPSNAHE